VAQQLARALLANMTGQGRGAQTGQGRGAQTGAAGGARKKQTQPPLQQTAPFANFKVYRVKMCTNYENVTKYFNSFNYVHAL